MICRGQLGFRADTSSRMPMYDQHIKRVFRPEFLNRLDEIVIFDPLDDSSLNAILNLRLTELYARLSEQQISLQLESDARAFLINIGTDPTNGARPLRRAVERLLIRPLGKKLLANFCAPGGTVIVSVREDRLVFTARQPAANGAG